MRTSTAVQLRVSKLQSWLHKIFAGRVRPLPRHPTLTKINSKLLNALPLEIRREIYSYVLHSYGIVQHICLSDKKLTHMRCVSPGLHKFFQSWRLRNEPCPRYDTAAYRESVQTGWEIMPLLISCRQIYQELVKIIYMSITFRLSIYVAERFLASVSPQHIALTQLYLSYSARSPLYLPYHDWPVGFTGENMNQKVDEAEWEAFWRTISHMSFRNLFFEIEERGMRLPETKLLEPLRQVRAEKFEVMLPWLDDLETSWTSDDVEFVIRRPSEPVEEMQYYVDKGYSEVGTVVGVWRRLTRGW